MELTSPINTDSGVTGHKLAKLPPAEFNIKDIIIDLVEHVMKTDYEHLIDRVGGKPECISEAQPQSLLETI